ncbi:hypothetical protein D9M71_761760 [compost metagenome]
MPQSRPRVFTPISPVLYWSLIFCALLNRPDIESTVRAWVRGSRIALRMPLAFTRGVLVMSSSAPASSHAAESGVAIVPVLLAVLRPLNDRLLALSTADITSTAICPARLFIAGRMIRLE